MSDNGAYEYRDKTLNVDALTIADALFIVRETKKIRTVASRDIRPRIRAQVIAVLEQVADGGGEPCAS